MYVCMYVWACGRLCVGVCVSLSLSLSIYLSINQSISLSLSNPLEGTRNVTSATQLFCGDTKRWRNESKRRRTQSPLKYIFPLLTVYREMEAMEGHAGRYEGSRPHSSIFRSSLLLPPSTPHLLPTLPPIHFTRLLPVNLPVSPLRERELALSLFFCNISVEKNKKITLIHVRNADNSTAPAQPQKRELYHIFSNDSRAKQNLCKVNSVRLVFLSLTPARRRPLPPEKKIPQKLPEYTCPVNLHLIVSLP